MESRPAQRARPAGRCGCNDLLVMPLVSSQIVGFDPESGKPTVTATAAGEIGVQPYVRLDVRQTSPQLITVSREGQLQGFGRRYEPVPQLLTELPGLPARPVSRTDPWITMDRPPIKHGLQIKDAAFVIQRLGRRSCSSSPRTSRLIAR